MAVAGLCPRLCRSRHDRRLRRLVRGGRAVSSSARNTDPAHGHCRQQQGTHRDCDRPLHGQQFPVAPSARRTHARRRHFGLGGALDPARRQREQRRSARHLVLEPGARRVAARRPQRLPERRGARRHRERSGFAICLKAAVAALGPWRDAGACRKASGLGLYDARQEPRDATRQSIQAHLPPDPEMDRRHRRRQDHRRRGADSRGNARAEPPLADRDDLDRRAIDRRSRHQAR